MDVASTSARAGRTVSDTVRPTVSDIRIPELDGLRGLMTLFVLYSHFFSEVPHPIGIFYVGWVGVMVFFVLSGYLVGRLIIEKLHTRYFLPVFYLRRVCRTFPIYFLVTAVLVIASAELAGTPWLKDPPPLPTWSYFVFLQNLFIIPRGSVGIHWLAPTWTLALEEQFYLFAPFFFLLLPRRFWIPTLVTLGLSGLVLRAIGIFSGWLSLAPLAVLPTSMDVLCVGLLLAVLVKSDLIDWPRWSGWLRVAPILCLLLTALAQRLDGGQAGQWFQAFGPFFVALAAAFFILMLVKGAPEARRFRSPVLRFFGDMSYSLYLTHLVVLKVMHGVILGTEPDTHTPAQFIVTLAAIPLAFALAWLLTKTMEQPITQWGRSFRWQ